MINTTKADKFRDVFQNSLKIESRSLSVKTLLSERNLRRINYSPYYQRNYVWDNEKQSFFIESVILGTEIPPLILFKTGNKTEVIDGRQRFETLKRFKEGDITLTGKGLRELQSIRNQSFPKMEDSTQDIFLESNIRVFEFEVINHPNLSDDIIDKVKKEIFSRYNTGITPLTRNELDNAKYDEDVFSTLFKNKLQSDHEFLSKFNACFFPKLQVSYKDSNAEIVSKNVDFIRRFRILNTFPISSYAGASDRTEKIDLLYEFANNNSEDIENDFDEFLKLLNNVLNIFVENKSNSLINHRLVYETVLWAMSILNNESVDCNIDHSAMIRFFEKESYKFDLEDYHYYRKVIDRYETTAKFFNLQTGFDFSEYIRDSKFSAKVKGLRQTEESFSKSLDELSNLRSHKQNPTSVPIDEVRHDLKTTKYLIRPSYQRQEKINQLKASSIIESILLGITLPPIFVYKRISGVKEIVDGQQRLLSIIGFIGEKFYDETGKLTSSVNNQFKLKGLRILTDLEGDRFSDLNEHYQDKILDFVLDLIIIEESMNESFDPVDLFIRLNYKPYPIKPNTFEMWNSIVDPDVIKKIKSVSKYSFSNWFFLRETNGKNADRMYNEELITVLSYVHYMNIKGTDSVIGLFPRKDTITCRVKDKKGLTNFLIELDNMAKEKEEFIESISSVALMIENLEEWLGGNIDKDKFNNFINVKNRSNFRRSLQDFYILWLVLIHVNPGSNKIQSLQSDLQSLLRMRINFEDKEIDGNYVSEFNTLIENLKEKYK
ncbi:DUF262 domain-containing protein [Vibrio crassostreae]|uniref:DUF262 domain-containing protein n=1 Tax=Vibrio crassostreae TaxID=246167 RepID=UPI0010EBB402|nr:DUF262 domain-containing protein [Vibrio crassostreae]TCV17644.1 uncharacterized protein DUF262 [Vibrio crassostreae]